MKDEGILTAAEAEQEERRRAYYGNPITFTIPAPAEGTGLEVVWGNLGATKSRISFTISAPDEAANPWVRKEGQS